MIGYEKNVRSTAGGSTDLLFLFVRLELCSRQGSNHDHGSKGYGPDAAPEFLLPGQTIGRCHLDLLSSIS